MATKKKEVKIRDLKPSKDAKGGTARVMGSIGQRGTHGSTQRGPHGSTGRGGH